MRAGKNARIQPTFSSSSPREHNNRVLAHTTSSKCATSAGLISNGICQGFSMPFCPSHGQVDSLGAALRKRHSGDCNRILCTMFSVNLQTKAFRFQKHSSISVPIGRHSLLKYRQSHARLSLPANKPIKILPDRVKGIPNATH